MKDEIGIDGATHNDNYIVSGNNFPPKNRRNIIFEAIVKRKTTVFVGDIAVELEEMATLQSCCLY